MMRVSREHALHGKPLLRTLKPQTGARTPLRGAVPTAMSKVSKAPRPSVAIGQKLLVLTGALSSG